MAKTEGARERFTSGQWERMRPWELVPLVPFYVLFYAGRELLRHRGTILAASLAFVTALSLVPLLSVAVSVLAGLNILEKDGSDLEPYLQRLFPGSASDIAASLEGFATTSASEVAGIGAIAFLVIGLFLFIAIERVYNIVWYAERERPWLQKSFAFVTLMTFGPALICASFAISGRAQFRMSQFGVDTNLLEVLLPFGLGCLLFTAMNHFLPTARVRWWASLLAGAFTATAFEFAKWGFNLYVTEIILVPYSQIYGTLGLFPLFLVWLYIVWLIVFIGAELAYCSQNLRTLVTIETAQQKSHGRFREHVFNPLIALELYAPIARAFKTGEGRVSEKDLLKRTGYSEGVVRSVVSELEAIGALDVVEDDAGERRLLPAKQLDDIKLLPIVNAFFNFEQQPNSLPMAKLLTGYRAVTLEVLRAEDALSLIAQDDELGQKYSQMKPWDPLPRSTLSESSSSAYEAPEVDDDPYESPPLRDLDRGSEVREDKVTLPAPSSAGSGPAPAKRSRRDELKSGLMSSQKESTRPVGNGTPVAESTDGIRINTRDILVAELDAADDDAPRLGGKKKEPSIEIDVAGMWDDFEADNYEEILQATEDELRRTEELDASDVRELGAEKSVPPPVPRSDKK